MALEDEIAMAINDLEDENFHFYMKGALHACDILGRMGGMSSSAFVQHLIYDYLAETHDRERNDNYA